MLEIDGLDAHAPREVAQRVRQVGVAKARMPTLPLLMLSALAGAFIGLGTVAFLTIKADPGLGPAASAWLGGLVFSLGLLLVVVAGAELFTGNNLLAMARAEGLITTGELLRNWVLVALGNAAGAALIAAMFWGSGLADGPVGDAALRIAAAKQALPWHEALWRGALCNVLVCLAVWMAMAGRSVVDKAVAVVPPVATFVAAGFEHSIANFHLFPLAWLLQPAGAPVVTVAGVLGNLVPVIAGNLLGGSVLVGLVYHLIYRHRPAD